MCFEFREHADAIVSNCTQSWKSAFFGKPEIYLFVVSKLRPSNYGHSGLNFRKTHVQLTVKLRLRLLQKIWKAELSTCSYIFRRLLLSYTHPIGLACWLPNKGSQFCRRERCVFHAFRQEAVFLWWRQTVDSHILRFFARLLIGSSVICLHVQYRKNTRLHENFGLNYQNKNNVANCDYINW